MATILSIRNLTAGFLAGGILRPAVRSLELDIESGECLALVGESGCGKSVTAQCILRIFDGDGRQSTGSITFKQRELMELPERDMRSLRGDEIAMIFQEPGAALDPCYTAGYHITEAIRAHRSIDPKESRAAALALLAAMLIPDPELVFDKYPHELSGGMQQRVMIAMALAGSPALLIADEPTTALDVTVQEQIVRLLRQKQKEHGLALLFITHDLTLAAEIAGRIAVMYAGEIVEIIDAGRALSQPEHPYTRALVQAMPRIGHSGPLASIPGSVPSPGSVTQGCAFAPRCNEAIDACRAASVPLEAKTSGALVRCLRR
jgi:oligopeptide/dipeptide ABC transporter ATP-binding protein